MKTTYLAVFLLLLCIHFSMSGKRSRKDFSTRACPFYPKRDRKHCKTDKDCPKGQSCCRYLLNKKLCTPSDPLGCYVNGRRVGYGHSYVTADKCHVCHCYGYNTFQCRSSRMPCKVKSLLK